MALPNVTIIVGDGALGRSVATADGVAALLLTGVAATGAALNTPKQIFSLSDAIGLGITAATHAHAYGQISDFYTKTGPGAELWIMLIAEATVYADVFDATTGPMDKLLKAARGRVAIAGVSMGRAAGYVATPTGILDFNVGTVGAEAQALALAYEQAYTPVCFVLDGTYMINPLTAPADQRGIGGNVSVFTGVSSAGKKASSMGAFIGGLAAIPAHQSIARVKSGMFFAEGYLTSGLSLDDYSLGVPGQLHDAGYITLRNFVGKTGAFISDDLTLASATSDFTSIARRRVMNKAIRLAYLTYVEELNDTIEIGDDGKLLPTKVSYIEDQIKRALETRMVAEGNCSAIAVSVDPAQNVLATDKIEIVVKVRPLGYLKYITVKLGFDNPANA